MAQQLLNGSSKEDHWDLLGKGVIMKKFESKFLIITGTIVILIGLSFVSPSKKPIQKVEEPQDIEVAKKQKKAVPQPQVQKIQKVKLAPVTVSEYEERKAYYKVDEPLNSAEEKVYFQEMEDLFLKKLPRTVDTDKLMDEIIKLNERYYRGRRSVLNQLSKAPQNDKQVSQRLAFVDYLSYRMRWDEFARREVASIIAQPIKKETPKRYQAAYLADKRELMRGLAQHDWELALRTLGKMEKSYNRSLASVAAYFTRLQSGVSEEQVMADIRTVYPSFNIKDQTK